MLLIFWFTRRQVERRRIEEEEEEFEDTVLSVSEDLNLCAVCSQIKEHQALACFSLATDTTLRVGMNKIK